MLLLLVSAPTYVPIMVFVRLIYRQYFMEKQSSGMVPEITATYIIYVAITKCHIRYLCTYITCDIFSLNIHML